MREALQDLQPHRDHLMGGRATEICDEAESAGVVLVRRVV
jgi:hypothetical protein